MCVSWAVWSVLDRMIVNVTASFGSEISVCVVRVSDRHGFEGYGVIANCVLLSYLDRKPYKAYELYWACHPVVPSPLEAVLQFITIKYFLVTKCSYGSSLLIMVVTYYNESVLSGTVWITASVQEYGGHVECCTFIIAIASYFNNGQQRVHYLVKLYSVNGNIAG